MRYVAFSISLLTLSMAQGPTYAGGPEHRDVEFQYVEGRIEVDATVVETLFPTSGIEQQFQTLPGFASEVDVGLGINPGDVIVYHVLDDLLYWDGLAFQAPIDGTQIRARNNPPSVPDTVISATSGVQLGSIVPGANWIGQALANGDFHSDLQFFLEPNNFPSMPPPPPLGAYGIKFALATSAPGIANSNPFIYVFNFGLDDLVFQNAVEAFGDLLVPPPLLGDMDCDGDVDFDDIDEFVLGLNDPAAYEQALGVPPTAKGDMDRDGDMDFDDISGFVDVLSADSPQAVPEPSCFVYALTGLLLLKCRRVTP